MEIFQPLINLIVVLTVLSLAAERAINLLKLKVDTLRARKLTQAAEREREYRISIRSFLVGVILAIVVKADFFELLTHLDDPWGTFGWVIVRDHHWARSPVTSDWGMFIYALVGCFITGSALGFGSKFWHDILGTVYDLRNVARNRAEGRDPLKTELKLEMTEEKQPDGG